VQYHLSATPDGEVRSGGAKVILDEVTKWARERGSRWLHLGGGLGGSEDDPLFRFKAGFSKIRLPFKVARWRA